MPIRCASTFGIAFAWATASAIVSDLCVAATHTRHQYATFQNTMDKDEDLVIERDWESEYFIHILAADRPGVLSNVAGLLAKHDVSLASVIQKNHGQPEVPVIFVTHKAHEMAMVKAIREISALPEVRSVVNVIRV
jgi:homoserine dehydrogenase